LLLLSTAAAAAGEPGRRHRILHSHSKQHSAAAAAGESIHSRPAKPTSGAAATAVQSAIPLRTQGHSGFLTFHPIE